MFSLGCKLALHTFNLVEARLSIVLFHRVLAAPDPMLPDVPDVAWFTQQMDWLRRGFNVLPLRDALDRLYHGKLPAGALCVTFDDGYRDNATNALPVLQRLGVPATFFVTTRYLDGGLMWNDRIIEAVRCWARTDLDLTRYGLNPMKFEHSRASTAEHLLDRIKYFPYDRREEIATDLYERSGAPSVQMMLTADDIQRLHQAGMEIGGHTVSHPILTAIDDKHARREIFDNKTTLETIIGTPIKTFAYPNGRPGQDYDARHVALVRESGFAHALTTAPGTAQATTEGWQIPRFTAWDRSHPRYLARMLRNYFRASVVAE